MKYSELVSKLENLENMWVGHLCTSVPNPSPADANGEVQFFSVEHASPTTPAGADLPVIVGVGINYGQNNPAKWPPASAYPVHHLDLRKPYPLDPKSNLVEDKPPAPAMRHALDSALDLYHRNLTTWQNNGYAPSARLPVINTNYILVATNFCPFITNVEWGQLPAPIRTKLLDASWPFRHLDDLHHHLGGKVDLWVGHGKAAVLQPFDYWRRLRGITNWLMMGNLSSRSHFYTKPTTRRRAFWQVPRVF